MTKMYNFYRLAFANFTVLTPFPSFSLLKEQLRLQSWCVSATAAMQPVDTPQNLSI